MKLNNPEKHLIRVLSRIHGSEIGNRVIEEDPELFDWWLHQLKIKEERARASQIWRSTPLINLDNEKLRLLYEYDFIDAVTHTHLERNYANMISDKQDESQTTQDN